jgi:hypothetical protein
VSTQDSPLLIPSEEIVLLMQGAQVVDLARVADSPLMYVCSRHVCQFGLLRFADRLCCKKSPRNARDVRSPCLPSLGRHSKQGGEKGNLTHAVPFFDTLLALLRIFVIQSH